VVDDAGALFLLNLLIAALLLALVWELVLPRRSESPGLAFRWANNLGLGAIDQLVLQLTHAGLVLAVAWSAQQVGMGLFHDSQLPWWALFAVTLLVFDFVGYLVHLVQHKVDFLWRFHSIHHSDAGLDFSSSYRHHPVESVISNLATLPVLMLLSPPVSVVVAFQALRLLATIFGHANIYLPERVDHLLRKLVITPDFHRLHHCSERKHTDSNYGTILPWFDYLFGTASNRPFEEQRTMQLGLEYFSDRKSSRLDQMLLLPFLWPVGTSVDGSPVVNKQQGALSGSSISD
jgi:sterol desaturase/sphingolipid hydroxylase (fatty acid hydroxylase superfamily)